VAHNRGGPVRRSGVAVMRQVAVTLALSLVVAGCALPSPSGSAMTHMTFDLGWTGCPGGMQPDVWVTGVVTPNADGFAAIKDDQGVLRNLVWGSNNTAVVEWGRRYRIGGTWFNTPDSLWACGGADAVIPR
jgi:hypothetical protein